jgi:hypothetical protein
MLIFCFQKHGNPLPGIISTCNDMQNIKPERLRRQNFINRKAATAAGIGIEAEIDIFDPEKEVLILFYR